MERVTLLWMLCRIEEVRRWGVRSRQWGPTRYMEGIIHHFDTINTHNICYTIYQYPQYFDTINTHYTCHTIYQYPQYPQYFDTINTHNTLNTIYQYLQNPRYFDTTSTSTINVNICFFHTQLLELYSDLSVFWNEWMAPIQQSNSHFVVRFSE